MKNMEHIKIYESVENGVKIDEYSNEVYNFLVIYKKDRVGYRITKSKDCKLKFIPDMMVKENFNDFSIEGIEISTTSYGYVTTEDLEQIVIGYNRAMETAKDIEKIIKSNQQ